NRSVREFGLSDPAEILNKTREIVIQEFEKSEEDVKDGMDIALCSLEGNSLKYAGANNPLWIIRKGSSEIEEIKANKQPIGKFDDLQPYDTHQLTLNQGDTIYVFSDGYADQFGGQFGKKMKLKGFKDFILSIKELDLETQKIAIDTNFEKWSDTYDQIDDICIIGVRV
ncbi:MAG: SpoIIE family protein phosphatase, partial [Crocinitomicaceae bacterium]